MKGRGGRRIEGKGGGEGREGKGREGVGEEWKGSGGVEKKGEGVFEECILMTVLNVYIYIYGLFDNLRKL